MTTPFQVSLSDDSSSLVRKLFDIAVDWSNRHQCAIGAAEMAVGAILLSKGMASGVIEMGAQLVATRFAGDTFLAESVGVAAGSIGALAGFFVGKIGVAAAGTAIGIPAVVLSGGAALILGLAGSGATLLAQKYLADSIGFVDLLPGASLLLIGTLLIGDGIQRILRDINRENTSPLLPDGRLIMTLPVADTHGALTCTQSLQIYCQKYILPFIKRVASNQEGRLCASTAAMAGSLGGAAVGVKIATGSVTVLGSKAIGGAALYLGLVAPPLWPVVAGTVIGGTVFCGIGALLWDTLSKEETEKSTP